MVLTHDVTRNMIRTHQASNAGQHTRGSIMVLGYNYEITKGEVEAVQNGESFSALVDGKILCVMSTGGCHRFSTKLQAEVAGRQYVRGYTGGSYLSADVDNHLT